MSTLYVAGAGAFGTALAISLARDGNDVTLWARDSAKADHMQRTRENPDYLHGIAFPPCLSVTSEPEGLNTVGTILLVVPTQALRSFLKAHGRQLAGRVCVLCCKGIEKGTGMLPSEVLADEVPMAIPAVLTGPGFATEIASGLPTALTLAMRGTGANDLQKGLTTSNLRLYHSEDLTGAQLGGALKNVIAIACGISIGAGLGESARAALMTRGFAEMIRLASAKGADQATLMGLSGFGDLALTCTSMQSRNFSLGHNLGQGHEIGQGTFEGAATAQAALVMARPFGTELPIARLVAAVLQRELTITEAVQSLMSRPLTSE